MPVSGSGLDFGCDSGSAGLTMKITTMTMTTTTMLMIQAGKKTAG